MPLSSGHKLGPYEIVAPLGAGGMGEVYRARDSKLKREVAIKVLPADVASDRERLARFQREAEVLASLNHPNIAHVYGIEGDGPADAGPHLVMELVEGDDLSQRIARGPIPLDEALAIAKQIADALEAAHDAGIVHRDLKPGNIKVRGDGTVKVLDFGLAKAGGAGQAGWAGGEIANSPTITSPAMTMRGVILGTAAYMSPEQAKGKAVDKRADIWAFGCVVYEMLTASRAFKGDDVTEIIAEVLKTDVDFTQLPSATPPAIRVLLERCLARDPRARLRDIGEARLVLSSPHAAAAAITATARGLSLGAAAVIAIAAMGVAGGGAWLARSPAPPAPRNIARVSWPYAEGRSLRLVVQRNQLTISRNGRVMAGIGTTLWIKPMDRLDWVTAPGTTEATTVFASPDGEWIGYLTRLGIGKARATGGGGVNVLSVQTSGFGPIAGSWGDDGRIYFVDERGIHAVHHDGGTVETIVTGIVSSVHVLPGSRALLYTRGRLQDPQQVMLHTLGGDSVLLTEGLSPRFVAPDTLVWKQDARLRAARLDVSSRRLVSAPIDALDEEVAQLSAFAQYDVSEDGTLVYVPASNAGQPISKLALRSRQGDMRMLNDAAHQYSDPRLSPDGRRLALHLSDRENDVWTFDLDRRALTRLTFHPDEDETPVWSPDGQWIAFTGSSRTTNGRSVFRRRADASGNEEELTTGVDHTHVTDWSPDGRTLLLEVMHQQRRSDIVVLDVAGKTTVPLIASPFSESSARLSPDGRWIAYQSDESGRFDIYVQSYPALDRKVQLSTQGGVQPVWARDGSTVYFRTETTLEASRLRIVNGTPQADAPVRVFEDKFVQPQGATHTTYDVAADGSVIVFQPPDQLTPSWQSGQIVGIFNWIDEVRARLPPR